MIPTLNSWKILEKLLNFSESESPDLCNKDIIAMHRAVVKITWDNVGKFRGEYLAHGEHSVILDYHQPRQHWTFCWSWRRFILFNFHSANTGRIGEDRSLLWSPHHFDSILEFSSEVFLDLLCLFTWTMNCVGVANHSFNILASKYERIWGTTQPFLLNHTPWVIKILWLKKIIL